MPAMLAASGPQQLPCVPSSDQDALTPVILPSDVLAAYLKTALEQLSADRSKTFKNTPILE